MAATPHDFCIPDDEAGRLAAIDRLVRLVVPDMFADDPAPVVLSVLSGGITNQLYRVKRATAPHSSVVCRVFGKETERLISRTSDQFWQSQFIVTFGRCTNGIVYEFLDGMGDCQPTDMARFGREIAGALARFHIKATAIGTAVLPYGTAPMFSESVLATWLALAQQPATREAILKKPDGEALAVAYDVLALGTRIAPEVAWVTERTAAARPWLLSGICHNDLLSGNIMCRRDPSKPGGLDPSEVKLIDFEYAGRGYFLYDIANHFNEYAGFECDWALLPTDDTIRAFLSAYYTELRVAVAAVHAPTTIASGTGVGLTPSEMEAAVRALKLMQCASHLVWGIWAVLQSAYSAIDFPYLPYGGKRLDAYFDAKARFLAFDAQFETPLVARQTPAA